MKNNPNLSRLGLLSFVICFSLTVNLFGQPEPLWKTKFKKNVKWVKVAPTGHLIVSTDAALVGIDPENGTVLWQREDLRKLKLGPVKLYDSWLAGFIPFSPYAIVRPYSRAHKTFKQSGAPYYITLVDVTTGQNLWSTETKGFKEHYGYFLLPEIGGMFIYAKGKKKKKTVFVVELRTGRVIWQKRDFFKNRDPAMFDVFPPPEKDPDRDPFFEDEGSTKQTIMGNQPPLFDTDETMITFMNKTAIRKFNVKTGELLWETRVEAKHPPLVRNGYAPMLLNESRDVLYTPCANRVYAVRTADGSLLWKSSKSRNIVRQMQLTSKGLVVLEEGPLIQDIALIDLTTGKTLWRKTYGANYVMRGNYALTKNPNFVIRDEEIIALGDLKLYSTNLADGVIKWTAEGLSFPGDELPTYLSVREDGYFLRSSNNIMLVSLAGEKVFQTYLEAPEFPDWGLLGEIVLADLYLFMVMRKGWEINEASVEWMLRLSDRARQLEVSLFNKNRETYTYILTQVETAGKNGVGLAKVNKFNGETEDQIVLENLGTKKPVYDIDEIDARLFFKSGKKEIVCYNF